MNQCGTVSLLSPREGLVLITGWKLERYVTEHKIKHTHRNSERVYKIYHLTSFPSISIVQCLFLHAVEHF